MRAAILLFVVLLVPTGAAASVSGRLALEEPPELRGTVGLQATEGIVDVSDAVGRMRLAWSSFEGHHVTREITQTAAGPELGGDGGGNASLQGGAGELVVECHGPCVVAVFALPGGSLDLRGSAPPRLAPVDVAQRFWAMNEKAGAPDSFFYEAPPGWLGVAGTEDQALSGAGALGLFVWNATATLRLADGSEETYETGVWSEPAEGPLGLPVGETFHRAFLALALTDATLAADPGAPLALFAPALRADLEGDLVAPRASGTLEVGGATRTLEHDRVDILDATIALDLAWSTTSEILPLATGAPTGDLAVQGQADRVIVGSQPIVAPTDYAAPAAGAALLAILLVAALRFPGSLFLLFSRITRADVLDNDNRRRLYEGIATKPGQNVTEAAREAGVAEVVARHHLRVLEQCRMIVVRPHGRARFFFPVEAASWAAHGAILRDPTRRAVAELVRSTGSGVTQKEVVAQMGLSQRLASYHLAQLEKAGLVVAEGERPRRYLPSQTLSSAPIVVATAEG